jgi:hypothetical protein
MRRQREPVSDPALHAIEFRILRYRNGRGAFSVLVKDLDVFTRQVRDSAAYQVELRSKWLDLEDINRTTRTSGGLPPGGEHRRLAEMVLDEMIDITRTNR